MINMWLSRDYVKYRDGSKRELDLEDERDFNRLTSSHYPLQRLFNDLLIQESLSEENERYIKSFSFICDLNRYIGYEKMFKNRYYPYYNENLFMFLIKIYEKIIKDLEDELVQMKADKQKILIEKENHNE